MPVACVEDSEIYYEVHGEGPAIVFAHGPMGNTLSWFQQVPHFAASNRVVTFDFRGWGRSTRAPGADVDLRAMARDLLAILDAADVERAALVGHAIGGVAAMRVALDHPERVSSLVLSSSAGGVMTRQLFASLADSSVRYTKGGGLDAGFAPGWWDSHPTETFLFEQIYSMNDPFDPLLLARLVEARIEPEEFAGYDTPTLVISGARDQLQGRGAIAEAARAIPGAKHVELPQAGFSTFFECPDEFNGLVSEFVGLHAPG
jgi:3-oxoadipate enol-lactonase